VEPNIGKVTIVLNYTQSEVVQTEGSEVRGSEMLMEKETRIQRLLPKQGVLSIEFTSKKLETLLLNRKVINIYQIKRFR
jgi:hypothetical protein